MYKVLVLFLMALVASTYQSQSPTDQLVVFKQKTQNPIGIMTTSSGMPIKKKYTGSTLNTNLYANPYFMDKINHFIREKIPERIVHAKAAGALGYFETTHNISHICKAELFSEIGKKTPVIVRFSVGVNLKGEADTKKTPMGFAIKFYTKEGNLDLLGLNTIVFGTNEPLEFPSFIHVLKRNPVTNMEDPNMLWDFVSKHPKSIFMFLLLLGERGIPLSYRHMPGYFIHTFQVCNSTGDTHFVRFHMIPEAGIKFMNTTEGARIAGSNPDYYAADLYQNIANGNFPSWQLSVQILSPECLKNAKFDYFDTTKLWPEDEFKLQPVGRLVLNENPINYFAQIEQLALSPAHLVPGIPGCPDKAFEARLMFYGAAHAYRLGVNYNNIPVNCPYRSKVITYNRDGVAPAKGNGDDAPNYEPNSFNGPVASDDVNEPSLWRIHQNDSDNFEQAKIYYDRMADEDRNSFVETVVGTLCLAANFIQDQTVKAFGKVHPDLSNQVAKGLIKNKCKH